jgi:tetratricopeptide (TPR) repeat protein
MTGAIWKSAFVAAFFALHPLHVESVAWIAERKDVLSAFFWMLTLCFYVYYTEKPAIRRYLPVIFSFACALMSKSMVVTLPVIMILLDYWPLGRFESKRNNWFLWQFKEKIPLFILSAFFSLITLFAQYSQPLKIYPLSSRIKNTPVSFVTYLEKIFWPHNLILFYPFSEQLPLGQVLGAVSLIFIISTAVIIMMKRLPYLFVGWLWYAITILPVIGIIQPGSHFADRYTYLPSIGIVIMLAWGIPLLFRREDIRKKILFPSSIAILAIMSFFTWQQCGYWKNDIELSKHLLRVTNDIDIKYLDMTPQNAGDYNNRGNAYAKSRDYQHSIEDYSQAILMKPDCAEYYYNRGTTFGEIDQYQRALKDFGKAVLLKPDYVDVYFSTGTVYAKLGQYQHAIESYNQAILLKPDYALAYSNRGFAYLLKGEKSLGCRDAQTSCALGNCQFLEMVKKEGFCR